MVADYPQNPRAVDGLDLSETDDGLVVYDDATDTVHHLNRTAAVVFGLCDGTRDAEAIADELGTLFGLEQAPLEETVTCLADLSGKGLIR
jgi:hypothetical protein